MLPYCVILCPKMFSKKCTLALAGVAELGECPPVHPCSPELSPPFPSGQWLWVVTLIHFLRLAVRALCSFVGLTAVSLWPAFSGSSRQSPPVLLLTSATRPVGWGQMYYSAGIGELAGSRSRSWWTPGPRAMLPEIRDLRNS